MIPLIDLHLWRGGNAEEQASLAAQVDHALRTSGFLLLGGHGVSAELRSDIRTAARQFFALPPEAKQCYATTVGGRGWVGPGREVNGFYGEHAARDLPDLKESYTSGRDLRTGDPAVDRHWFAENLWPTECPALQPLCEQYMHAVHTVYREVLELLAGALRLPPQWFTDHVAHSPHTFNINRYPPLTETGPATQGQYRIAPHTDWGMLTILDRQAGYGGLQVQMPDGHWVSAPDVPDAFTVNIGDLMARWTGDRWRSTRHRVLPPSDAAPDEELLSLIMFCEVEVDTAITSLPAPIGHIDYPPITAGDYLTERARAATIA